MRVFHLSHTDLDGYGCQFVSREFFQSPYFYNANYGKEVLARINLIFNKIDEIIAIESKLESKFRKKTSNNFLILITDLNLTISESKYVDERVAKYKADGIDVELLLLDHHVSGQECANIYKWYILDSSRCATKISFEYFTKRFSNMSAKTAWLCQIVEMINSIDIWREEGEFFDFGKVALGMIASSNELNRFMFDEEHRIYKFSLLDQIKYYLGKPKGEVAFDNAIFRLKKIALKGDPDNQTMDFITSNIQAELLGKMKEKCRIFYKDKSGFLSYGMGGISVLANLFLRQNEDVDFYMDINLRGTVSLRANGNCDVSLLSKEIFNGGGHRNAAGGKMDGFRESFCYEDVKAQVQAFIKNRLEHP